MNKKSVIKLAEKMILASEQMDRAGKSQEAKILLNNSLTMLKKASLLQALTQEIMGKLPKAHFLTPWRTTTYKGLEHLDYLAKTQSEREIRNYLKKLAMRPSKETIQAIAKSDSPQQIWNLLGKEKLLGKGVHPDMRRTFTPLSKIGTIPFLAGISSGFGKKQKRPIFENEAFPERPIFENEAYPEENYFNEAYPEKNYPQYLTEFNFY